MGGPRTRELLLRGIDCPGWATDFLSHLLGAGDSAFFSRSRAAFSTSGLSFSPLEGVHLFSRPAAFLTRARGSRARGAAAWVALPLSSRRMAAKAEFSRFFFFFFGARWQSPPSGGDQSRCPKLRAALGDPLAGREEVDAPLGCRPWRRHLVLQFPYSFAGAPRRLGHWPVGATTLAFVVVRLLEGRDVDVTPP